MPHPLRQNILKGNTDSFRENKLLLRNKRRILERRISAMKNIIVMVVSVSLFFSAMASAQDHGFGLGIIVGEPTGVSLKTWTGNRTAFDFALAWSFGHKDALHVHVDYLFHNFSLFKVEKGDLVLYYGIGGRVKAVEKTRVGVRIPIGISYFFERDPIEIFFELGPILDLAPSTDFYMTGGIGIRYFFD